ncbi:hypothetical protein MP638_007380 [Amoeboaphelidium occidentale]|nr:hypothetical protein MP638_007380 [Amoeboaphelidium occidentale]
MNIVRFTRQYVDFILSREVGSELTRENYNQVKQFILAELERNSSDSNLKRFPFEALMVIKKKKLVKRPQSEHDALFASIIKIWDTARDVLQCRNLTKSVVKKEWWLYIPSMYQTLKVVCANYKEVAEERKKSRKRGRALRLYSLVPLCHYQQRHIPIDSSGLHEIMSLAKLHGKFDSIKRDDVYDNPDLYWRSVFELRKVETFCDGYKLEVADYQLILPKTKVPSRRFRYHITTDGVQVGISVLKPLNEATVNEWGLDDEEVFHPLPKNSETRIVAIDPGRRNLYDAVAGDEDSREVMKCTNSRWREISGAKHGLQKRSHWMSLNKDLMKTLTNGPSPKCCNTETYKTFLKHFFSVPDQALGFFRPAKWRRLRFKTRITRQKAYDVVAKELTGGDSNCIIAYGGGAKHGLQKRSHWMSLNKDLMKTLTNGPSPKCCNTETYKTFLKHFFSVRDQALGFFRPAKWRRLRFKTRITRQKAYDVVAKELTGGDSNCIIAYGGGKFSSSSKGHAPTPNKHLFVELRK